jgi:radical SAM protein with 4Fe4S-binding SPASM domain
MRATTPSATRSSARARYEAFGGIVALEEPAGLAFVDRQMMRELGYPGSPLWRRRARGHEPLSAPTEVHFNVTSRCPLHCRHCTTDAGEGAELDTAEVKAALDVLARAGVFHVAFGGGEFFLRDDAIELARYARAVGLVPNATTNGHVFTRALARKCRVFGQINVSLDGVGLNYDVVRGAGSFALADRTLRWLREAGVDAGVNCVVARVNFDHLEEVVAYADRLGLCEVLCLRLKPSGRARAVYHDLKLTAAQGRALYPLLRRLARRYRPRIQVDCSFVPHLCSHRPSKRLMRTLGVDGCGAGNLLLGVRADGSVNGCSHHPDAFGDVRELPALWPRHPHFRAFRTRRVTHPACRACPYFEVCRGGCPLFSEFLAGDFQAPDPECPRLLRWLAGTREGAGRRRGGSPSPPSGK